MNNIKPYSIGNLILNRETPDRDFRVEHYLIPAYQRGYRWTNIHVLALLEDIDNFLRKNRSSDEYYCLQPIVVTKQKDADGKRIWEVIDGQQRLITLYIIFLHLKTTCFELEFGKRPKSETFIKNLENHMYDDSNPDFHFMGEAHKLIEKWFAGKATNDSNYGNRFSVMLKDKVKVIWYEIDLKENTTQKIEDEKIDAFNRLNIGKIPLEDAELVRALLMSKFIEHTQRELLMRQSEFSNEWYEIEHTLQDEQMWKFLTKKTYSNHIQLIFELMAGNKNSSNYNTYKWFETQISSAGNEEDIDEYESNDQEKAKRRAKRQQDKARDLWSTTKSIFANFRYWYSDRTIYHYVGYLLASSHVSLEDILKEAENDKTSFKRYLHTKILYYLNSVNFNNLDYINDADNVKKVLLLFNVLTCESLTNAPQNRFQFNLYNEISDTKKWSLEHIHAQQSADPLSRNDIIKKWIDDTLSSLEKVSVLVKSEDEEDRIDVNILKERLRVFKNETSIDKDAFNVLRQDIVRAFDSKSKHLLDNMALLSCPDNAKLNNAIFPVKRDRIIQMEKEGHFIPICTRNVFLKLYSKADNQPYFWSSEDKESYVSAMYDLFEKFKNKNI